MTADSPQARTEELTDDLVTFAPHGYGTRIDCQGCDRLIRLPFLIGGHDCPCGLTYTADITVEPYSRPERADGDADENTTQTTDS